MLGFRALDRALLTVLAILVCYQTYYCANTQKTVGLDAAMGFLTLQSSLEHGDFNRIHHPAPTDLRRDQSDFITWWTPGQYLIPHGVAVAIGSDIGTALRFVSVFFSLAGLTGYYLLYAKLGFDRTSTLLCLIVICGQDYFLKSGRVYLGGELLIFPAAPYVALAVVGGRIAFYSRALVAAGACLFALFLKASSLALFCALTLYLVLEVLQWPDSKASSKGGRVVRLRPLLVLGGLFLAYILLADFIYLSRGVTISSSAGPMSLFSIDRWWGVAVALAAPFYGAFSFLESRSATSYFIPVALLSLLSVWKLNEGLKKRGFDDYRRLLVAHYVGFVVFFSYAYLRGMDVSYEPRHFRAVGLLLIPGLIYGIINHRYRTTIAVAVAMLSLVSVAFYHLHYNRAPQIASLSRWGIRQPVSNASLEAMHRIDQTYVTAETIVFNGFSTCPSLLLEFEHGRGLVDENKVYLGYDFLGRGSTPPPWYRNTADSLVLMVPKNTKAYFGATLEEITKTFEHPLHIALRFEDDEMAIYTGSAR